MSDRPTPQTAVVLKAVPSQCSLIEGQANVAMHTAISMAEQQQLKPKPPTPPQSLK